MFPRRASKTMMNLDRTIKMLRRCIQNEEARVRGLSPYQQRESTKRIENLKALLARLEAPVTKPHTDVVLDTYFGDPFTSLAERERAMREAHNKK